MSRSAIPASFDLRRLLRPRSVAIAGASPELRSIGGAILRNLRASGFGGPITLVSPTRDEIDGQPCLRSLREIPQGTDAVVLNIPRVAIRQAVEDCIERSVGGVVVFASGFSEAGEAGRAEQDAIAAMCREAGLALLGPNCLGFTDYAAGVALSFEDLSFGRYPVDASRRRVAVIAQSGATAANIRDALQGRGIAVSQVIASGNEAVLRMEDFIGYALDEGASVIAAYVEQVRNPAAFLAVARRAREQGVPIVMLHPGRSARARAAAQSHTGALTGDYAVMKTCVENEAVVLVETMDELFDSVAILQRFTHPPAGSAAIITNSGAIRGLSLDMMEDFDLPAARPGAATLERLQSMVPAGLEIDLPLDLGTAGYADAGIFGRVTQALLDDEGVGSVIWAMVGGGPSQQRSKAQAMIPVMQARKAVILTIIGDQSELDAEVLGTVREHDIPFFRSPDRCLRAVAAVHRHAAAREAAADRSAALSQPLPLSGNGALPEYVGKRWLRELGVPVPRSRLVHSFDEAREAAQLVGYPLVIKAQSAGLAHKSDVGGVIVGIRDDDGLRAAWTRLHANLAAAAVTLALDGILVEQMARPGLEMVVGAKNDADWGPVILVGLGGVWIEALRAVQILPPDISHRRAVEKIRAMRGASLLGPFRGQAARDVDALADIVVKLGAALRADASIREIDINPVMVFAEGEGAMALDALIVRDGDDGHPADESSDLSGEAFESRVAAKVP